MTHDMHLFVFTEGIRICLRDKLYSQEYISRGPVFMIDEFIKEAQSSRHAGDTKVQEHCDWIEANRSECERILASMIGFV